MRILYSTILVLSFGFLQAQGEYSFDKINKSLLDNANAVVRESTLTYEVKEKDKTRTSVKQVITVLNSKGNGYGVTKIFYDEFRKIGFIKLKIYDERGKQVRKYNKLDFMDVPAISNFSLYEDSRVLLNFPDYATYPYTIELEYTINGSSLLNTPNWEPQYADDIAIERSSLKIIQTGYSLRIKEIDVKPTCNSEDSKNICEWVVANLSSKNNSDDYRQPRVVQKVYTSPSNLYLDGYSSENRTWNDFGSWFYSLNSERDVLSPEQRSQIEILVKDLSSDSLKISRIYKHLQSSKRYVNISLGIGGYQSFPASTVEEVGYGDCKALSTYTKAALKTVGIESNYVLIKAGEDKGDFQYDFPSNQFNHVILAVPSKGDTTWLECTSGNSPVGFLGNFTDNRYGLFVSNRKSSLVRTPAYGKDQNKEVRSLDIFLDGNGSADIDLIVHFSGLRIEKSGLSWIVDGDEDDKRKWIYEYLQLPNVKILDYYFMTSGTPDITLRAKLRIDNFAEIDDSNITIGLIPFSKKKESKNFEIFDNDQGRGYELIDSLSYHFPDDYILNNNPDIHFTNESSEYNLNASLFEDEMKILRTFIFNGQCKNKIEDSDKQFWRELTLAEKYLFFFKKKT